MDNDANKKSRVVDWAVVIPAVLTILVFAALIFAFPSAMDAFMTKTFWAINNSFGWLWLLFCLVCFFICIWLVLGKYRNKRFGDSKPKTSTFSFYANLFVWGSSASLVYWVFLEFYSYLSGPPFGVEPFSTEALKWSSSYGAFHWGIVPFSIYAVAGVAYAFFMFVMKRNTSRVGAACEGLIGRKRANGLLGKVLDYLYMVGVILSNSGYSLAVSVPIIAAFAAAVFGISSGIVTQAVIIILITLAMTITIYSGLYKGVTLANNIRVIIFFVLCAFVVVAGPTTFIINNTVESIGWQLQHFFQMTLYTSAADNSGWSQGWTMFFNIMFIAPIISSGLYYGRLYQGRKVSECVIGTVVASAIGCGVFFWTVGNYSIATYLGDPETFIAMYNSSPYDAIIYVVNTLPGGKVILAAILIYAFLSAWTFVQSSVYGNAMAAQPNLPDNEEPSKIGRVGWCILTGIMTLAFLYVGGLQTVKNAMIWAGIPSFIVAIFLIVANFKDMHRVWGKGEDPATIRTAEKE